MEVSVAAGIVRWVKGEEFGAETLVQDYEAQARLSGYIRKRMKNMSNDRPKRKQCLLKKRPFPICGSLR